MNTTASSTAAGTGSLQLDYLSSAASGVPIGFLVAGRSRRGGIRKAAEHRSNPHSGDRQHDPFVGRGRLLRSVAGRRAPTVQLSSGGARRSRVHYRYSDDLLFGSLTIAEQAIDARSEAGALLHATEIAYQEIFDVLNDTEHRHLIRIWNYLPEINAQAGGDERYRHFNSARQMAFRKSGRATMGTVPAACALGSPAGSPISHLFSGRAPSAEDDRESAADQRLSLPAEIRQAQSDFFAGLRLGRIRRRQVIRFRHRQHRRS